MAWTDLVHKFLGHGTYNATLPTKTDGQSEPLQVDSRGRLLVSVGATVATPPTSATAGTTWVDSLAVADTGVISASAKSLLFAQFQSLHAAPGYIQLFNLASDAALSSGVTVPAMAPIAVAPYGTVNIDLPRGRYFSAGIVWAFSARPLVYFTESTAVVAVSAEIV